MPQSPGQKGILAMGAGKVPHSTAPLRAAGPQHLVTSHLSAIKCQETPSFIQTTGLNAALVLRKFSHEKEKAQLTLYNGFFKTLHIFISL